MAEDFKYDVFLSHSSKDKPAARELAERLRRDGLRVWFDEWEIKPGDAILLKIQAGLAQARNLVLLMSQYASASEWVTFEHHAVLFRDPTNQQRRFIPVRLDDAEIRDALKQFAYVDWRQCSEEQYTRLLAACRSEMRLPAYAIEQKRLLQQSRILNGHSEWVSSVSISPDNQLIVSGAADETVRVWGIDSGECLATLKGHSGPVRGVAVTPDGKFIISSSNDRTIRLWEIASGKCVFVFKGHFGPVTGITVTQDNEYIISASGDRTVRRWEIKTGRCVSTFKGHNDYVKAVAITQDGELIISGSEDGTVRIWEAESEKCDDILIGMPVGMAERRNRRVEGVAVTPDGKYIISSLGHNVRVWETYREPRTLLAHVPEVLLDRLLDDSWPHPSSASNDVQIPERTRAKHIATLEGHTGNVNAVAVTQDGRHILSASGDSTLGFWDRESGERISTLIGHTGYVQGIAVTSDGRRVVSASSDKTVRVWDLFSIPNVNPPRPELVATQYTNAKVLLVGDSGVGKSGLALRLTEDRFEPTISTDAVWATQMKLPHNDDHIVSPPGLWDAIEREIWLWDFAGQADYRLVHQLFMDETALAVLVFNPQAENPFEGLGQWDRDLQRAARRPFKKLLVAGRCDRGGLMVSREGIERFRAERGFNDYLETSAQTGAGCNELREAIIRNIPWDEIPWTASPHIFRLLKEEIVRLKDEGKVLLRMGELKQQLEMRLLEQSLRDEGDLRSPLHGLRQKIAGQNKTAPAIPETFKLEELRAVVGLLAGPGVVWQLDFGDFVLLQPERINAYAAAVVRKVRAHPDEIGSILEEDVLAGKLDYQDMRRLTRDEEQIVLRAMHQTFVDHGLCLREPSERGPLLVFPSYFKRERPEPGATPAQLVTYSFSGMLDEIYATLVVRLHYTTQFEKDQLWRFAADFKTLAGQRVGLKMTRKAEGAGEITVYCALGVAVETQVNFIRYVHDHLKAKDPDLRRTRHYVCGHCGTPVMNHETVRKKLLQGKKEIICVDCEKQVLLWDLIEEKFASEETQREVRAMEEQARRAIDNESRELILVGHAFAIAGEAGQIFRPVANSDWGIDGEIEFKDDNGNASGRRVYLQLKSGDSYLESRKDGREVFRIKHARHAEYWQAHEYPVMLVIRTSDGVTRWMNVSDYLRRHGRATKQIIFEGEPFTALSLVRLRDRVLAAG
jgi:WD40 repeat protein/GTPase SAR1 family protein/DNA-directed RNA polymerase subunit RPC12/RpoP